MRSSGENGLKSDSSNINCFIEILDQIRSKRDSEMRRNFSRHSLAEENIMAGLLTIRERVDELLEIASQDLEKLFKEESS